MSEASKNPEDQTEDHFGELEAKIQPKLNKIWKTFRKQGFFENCCSILMVFHSFFNFGWILALQLTRVDFSLVVQIFYTPGTSGGMNYLKNTPKTREKLYF